MDDLSRIFKMLDDGMTQHEIALEFGVDQKTISYNVLTIYTKAATIAT